MANFVEGLLEKISAVFKGSKLDQVVDPKQNTSTGVSNDTGSEMYDSEVDVTYAGYMNETRQSRARLDMYNQYLEMEEQFPEIHSGLDMYADYTVSGGGIDTTDNFEIECKDEKVLVRLKDIEKRIKLSQKSWAIVRAMCRQGDVFAELVFDSAGMSRVKVLPAKTMTRREDQYGNLKSEGAFIQRVGSKVIKFEPWQIVHFRNHLDEEEMYGRSILFPIRRLSKELVLCEDALTIARLTRAHQRWKWTIDVTGMTPTDGYAYVERYKRDNRRRRSIDPNTGRLMTHTSPLRAEEDVYIPKQTGGVGDITPMSGDNSINSISDVLHKYDRLFTALKVSKAWFGLTGPNIRSVMGEQGLNFMRTVRRIRAEFTEGAIKTYMVALKADGMTMEEIEALEIDLKFPMMSHADDEMRYKLDLLRLQVVEKYRDLRLMSRTDVFTEILKIPKEKADRLIAHANDDPSTPDLLQYPDIGEQPKEKPITPEAYNQLKDQLNQVMIENEEIMTLRDEIRELAFHIMESK